MGWMCHCATNTPPPEVKRDSRLDATLPQDVAIGLVHLVAMTDLCGKLGSDVRVVLSKWDRGITAWVFLGVEENSIAASKHQAQFRKMKRIKFQILENAGEQLHFSTYLARKAGGDLGRSPNQSQKPNQHRHHNLRGLVTAAQRNWIVR